MAAFQFEVGFQRSILRLMQLDDVFCLRCIKHVSASYFTAEPLGWIFSLFDQYWQTYHTTCGDIALRGALRHVSTDKTAQYSSEIEAVIGTGVIRDEAYVKTELGEFCKRNLFAQAHQESARLFNGGKAVDAYDVMALAQDAIRQVDFGAVDRQWYFEELSDRQRERYMQGQTGHGYSTGIQELDVLTNGGVQPGEVWAVLAYAKRCKTTWLCNQGFTSLRMYGDPVLHIVLEGHGRQIAAKYDALFSGALYTDVKRGLISPERYGELQAESAHLRRLLVIRTLNDWDVTAMDVKAEIEELRSHNFRPKLMILDYVDLLRSRYKADSEMKHQVESSRDIKRLVNAEGFACWTAWQAQRPKANANTQEHVLTSGSVADAYAKVRIVDAFGSLNATDDEMARGEMRVFWEGHRDAPVNRCWLINNDLSRQRIVTGVISTVEIKPEPAAK